MKDQGRCMKGTGKMYERNDTGKVYEWNRRDV